MEIKYINRATGAIETENPPAVGLLKFLYKNPIGTKTILPFAKRKLITALFGKRMDKPASIQKIQPFIDALGIDMSESKKQVAEFTSFNDFFYRMLKPGARPIGKGLVSPGDGRLLAFENFEDVHHFYVKGRKFTLKEFLGDEVLAKKYKKASMIILRLAPNDYHRYHFPYAGVPSAIQPIKGHYYSVSPYALIQNFTKVFCENKRELCTLEITDKTPMLILPVGATMVGSMHSTFTPEKAVEKGEEMGYFAFGGSTVVMLFNSKDFEISPDLLENTKNKLETYVKMGETIGVPKS
ncbi:phosphatidylserine decarboxylase [Pustulibacterium marinum]|uniref:phosphatidylserine decarboxylase n=1 Tax=Pustulibacterium marinum TaxID=1224947 RepID=A0A1I7FTN3_9FLAO|nr:archaetidylserine decarboxylase [Pustulibacterium marinum]SFU39594.1 phosphatidylserine decarboxylase [Pustulibacterium marinum]